MFAALNDNPAKASALTSIVAKLNQKQVKKVKRFRPSHAFAH